MKLIVKIIAFLLCISFFLMLFGCTEVPNETVTTKPTPTQPNHQQQDPTQSTAANLLEIPDFKPQDQLILEDPASWEEWVFTNYDHTISWRDPQGQFHTMTIRLPAMTPAAQFAVKYNQSVAMLAQLLFTEIRSSFDKGYHPFTLSLTYEASYVDDILFIVMERRMDDGMSIYYVDAFDLEDRESLHLGEISEELTGMDYPTFILAAEDLIRQEFIRLYEPMIKELEKQAQASAIRPTEPDVRITDYYDILDRLPYLTLYLSQTRLFADSNGQLMLYIYMPGSANIPSVRGLIPFDLKELSWEKTPSAENAYGRLLDVQYSVDGIHADAYSIMLTEAFLSDPEEFIEYAALESSESIANIISYFRYNLYKENLTAFIEECHELLLDEDLTQKEQAFLHATLDALQ